MVRIKGKIVYVFGTLTLLLGVALVIASLKPEVKLMPQVPLMGPIRYNCELSGGSFKNGHCTCSIEEGQTQGLMYGYYLATVSERGNWKQVERYIEKQGKTIQEVQLKLLF